MKKIGLVTYYNSDNYGAMLQAYALQEEIKRNNCECTIIASDRFDFDLSSISKKDGKIQRILRNIVKYPHSINVQANLFKSETKHQGKRVKFKNSDFRNQVFDKKTNEFYYTNKQIEENPPLFDGYVCGSDQIWSPERINGSDAYYLHFVPAGRTKISYGPSLGTNTIPESLYERYRQLTSDFDFLSLREESGCEEIKKITGKAVSEVLDPVFLKTKKEWKDFSVKAMAKDKYLLCYFISKENLLKAERFIEETAKTLNLQVIVLPYGLEACNKKWKSVKDVGPREFVGLIDGASYVLTDSFHGSAFSIILEKGFSVFADSSLEKTRERFARLDNLLRLSGLYYKKFCSIDDLNLDPIDYKFTNRLVKERIDSSKKYLANALNTVKEVKNSQTKVPCLASKPMCTGCSACLFSCPKKAISMNKDEEGFWRPTINEAECIKCRKCEMICPVIHAPEKNKALGYKAIYCKDKEFRKQGSSGNLFGVLANHVLSKGGVVFGAALSQDQRRLETKSTNEVSLKQLQGSKYFESDMNSCIAEIKKALDEKKPVLFTGTPCQVQGIRRVFGNNSNLILCDLICHGVPSVDIYNRYIDSLEKQYGSKVKSVSFRSKKLGWRMYCMYVEFENGKTYLKNEFEDPWVYDFLHNKHLRDCCYSCNRVLQSNADLTIGDYWAVNVKKNMEDTNEGISVVRINTKCGKLVLDEVCDDKLFVKDLNEKEVDETFVSKLKKRPKKRDFSESSLNLSLKQKVKGKLHTVYSAIVHDKG